MSAAVPTFYRALSLPRLLSLGSAAERAQVLGLWLLAIAASVGSGLYTVTQGWSGLPLQFGGVQVFVTLYPPLPICLLLTLCWGWWWGAVPAWLATFSLALYAGMPAAWAALFACTNPLGFAIMVIGYKAIAMRRDLREPAALLFFVQLSFIASVFSSAGALIWCYTNGTDRTGMLPIWQGWWLGAFLQSVLIVGPLLAWLWPAVLRWQTAHAHLLREPASNARRRVLLLLAATTSGVLLYGYATARLAERQMALAPRDDARALLRAAEVLQETLSVFFWVYAAIIVFAAFLGFQLYAHWQRSNDRLLDELHRANESLDRLAHTDALSGLLNRRAADARLKAEFARARRHAGHVSLLMLDIDHFKQINDRNGHPAGDAVIRRLAGLINAAARGMDVTARYGGEEFLIVLPDTDAQGAHAFAERLRESVEAAVVAHQGLQMRFQISLGVAELEATDGSHAEWLARADRALYRAKETGRNRVVIDGAQDALRSASASSV